MTRKKMLKNTSSRVRRQRSPMYLDNVPTIICMIRSWRGEAAGEALGERGDGVGDEGGRLQDYAGADHVKSATAGQGYRHVLHRQQPRKGRAENSGDETDQAQQRHAADGAQYR